MTETHTHPKQSKPPTPTHDEELTLAIRQLAGYTIKLDARIEAVQAAVHRGNRTRSLSTAFGVLVGMAAFSVFGWIIIAIFSGLSAGLI